MSTSASPSLASLPSPERTAELHTALTEIRARIAVASASNNPSPPPPPQQQQQRPAPPPTLVAVSKFKPAEDVRACYDAGQRDFGENYAQQLVEKAAVLPHDVRWHFIGTVQSNKAKVLAGIENLYAVQTVASAKCADALNRYRQVEHGPLRVFIQLNTSGEQTKGGIDMPSSGAGAAGDGVGPATEDKLTQLATHIVRSCPRLRLVGLMTIGKPDGGSEDFVALREARDRLVRVLPPPPPPPSPSDDDDGGVWGEDVCEDAGEGEDAGLGSVEGEGEKTRRGRRRLLLSMGMSHDFEMALRAGADVVRVGTGIFGARPPKKGLEEVPPADAEQP